MTPVEHTLAREESAEGRAVASHLNPAWKRTFLFLVFGAVFLLLLQTVLLQGLRRSGEGNVGILNRVMQEPIDADILISGSSRAMYHYDPRAIEAGTGRTAFNIGRNGTKLHEQLHLLRLYLQRNRAPAYVLQNVDVTNLSANDDVTDPKQYIAWLHREDVYRPLVALRRYYAVYRALPLLAIARTAATELAVLGLVHPKAAHLDEFKGYTPQYRTWDEDFEKFRTKNPGGVTVSIDPRQIQTLHALLKLAKESGIRVILVYSPDYVETQSIFNNRDEVIHTFLQIAEREQVPFWDYSNDAVSKDRANFYNSQHLNHNGATAFTQSLTRRLVAVMCERAGAHSAAAVDDTRVAPVLNPGDCAGRRAAAGSS
jgi:hypothetical protein